MNNAIFEILLALIGGGAIGFLVKTIINSQKREDMLQVHEREIMKLKDDQEEMKMDIKKIETNTSVRLTKIETQITAIQTQQNDIAKDVKLILKSGVYKGE